jgi:LacI family repressor for deo operon, udp, cdd, tsx, nupC, and nupG
VTASERPLRVGRPAPSSIHDVARAAGVSTATVSRALRGLDRVSPDTRAKVREAARELQYVPSPSAASLKSGKTGVVGVIVPFLTRWFFTTLMDGAEAQLRQSGYHLLLFNIGARGTAREHVLDPQLLAKRLDGLLVLSADLDASEAAMLRRLHLPLVTVGLDLRGCDRVGIDDVAAADAAVSHLVELGHRRIAYLGGNPDDDVHMATALERWAGVQQAARRHRVGVPADLHVHGDWTVRGGMAAASRLLDLPSPPTAILAASDEMAIGVLCEARRRRVRVPKQLSVMGIDDHEMSFTHDLTTIRQDVSALGSTAAELLLARLQGSERHRRRQVELPTELIVRGSTAAPPPGAHRS